MSEIKPAGYLTDFGEFKKSVSFCDNAQALYYSTDYEALQKENAAQAKRIAELEAAPEYQEPENQLDMPLPCDIRIGAGTIKKGCKLSVLVARMNVLYQLAMKTQLGIGEPANQEPTKDE